MTPYVSINFMGYFDVADSYNGRVMQSSDILFYQYTR